MGDDAQPPDAPLPEDPWAGYEEDRPYDIESIVGAELIGRGWRLQVKWAADPVEGRPSHISPEPLHKILRQTRDPEILADIERCKQAYLASRTDRAHAPTVEAPQPTRIQPERERSRRRYTAFAFEPPDDGQVGPGCATEAALHMFCHEPRRHSRAP